LRSDWARLSSSLRSCEARVGFVARRGRSTLSAACSASTTRSVASCRFRHWLRSSCAIPRSTGPAFATTRRFCASESADDAWTSKIASTRLSVFCACWPPGPLERENRSSISDRGIATDRVTRIDSLSMAAILLDVEGVLQVSGRPLDGATRAVLRLRESGHRIRFVTNSTTSSRANLAKGLRNQGIELEDEELQTSAIAAVHALKGKRVLALTMAAVVEDLEGIELVGDTPDAVLLGGADETEETNRVFSYMNLARAFAELDAGADLFCLHKNRWWQTERGPLLDTGALVAGLEYAAGIEATVLGKPSPAYFAAALDALDADADMAWMVGDDLESDIAGARAHGLRTVLVRSGKFRQRDLDHSRIEPDVVLDSIADLPYWLDEHHA
jgi:HAD superfamily hydrolase (TIGR01458 family)